MSLCFNGLRKDDGGNPKRDADKMEKSKLLFNNPSGCFIIVYILVVGSAKACGAKGFYQSMGEFRGLSVDLRTVMLMLAMGSFLYGLLLAVFKLNKTTHKKSLSGARPRSSQVPVL